MLSPHPLSPRIFGTAKLDFLLLACPFWLAIFYIFLIKLFPSSGPFIFFIYLFLFGEMHFASTWLFFTNDKNVQFFYDNKFLLFFIPIIGISIFIYLGLNNLSIAIFLVAAASSYHVTRQSIGIFRLFGGAKNSLPEFLIYICSIFWLLIGFYRFFLESLLNLFQLHVDLSLFNQALPYLELLGINLGLFGFGLNYLRTKKIDSTFALLTGIFLYFPYTFVNTPQDAVAIGVSLHWCQYLALSYKLYLKPANGLTNSLKRKHSLVYKLLFLFSYALIASCIQTNFGSSLTSTSLLILIPLSLQMYHFYLDAFIWRFSNPFIRENIGRKLFE